MYSKLKKLDINYSAGVKEEDILKFENRLNVKFGYRYKEFLKEFGCLSMKYLEFYGICGNNSSVPSAIHATLERRKLNNNFPLNMIVIFETGNGVVYTIDAHDKVYKFDLNEVVNTKVYFDQFIINEIQKLGIKI